MFHSISPNTFFHPQQDEELGSLPFGNQPTFYQPNIPLTSNNIIPFGRPQLPMYGPEMISGLGSPHPIYGFNKMECIGKHALPFDKSNKRKALLIGINYIGTQNELKGCINDVHNLTKFLIEQYRFTPQEILILTDDQIMNPQFLPTRHNIISAMHWLVHDAQPGDSLFFHYSGHGSQREDTEGDEEDGYDETILPMDFKIMGEIVDDEMNAIMVRNLPPTCRLTCIFDCCHSGTALDLPYVYSHEGRLKSFNPLKTINRTLFNMGYHHLHKHSPEAKFIVNEALEQLDTSMEADVRSKLTRGSNGEVIMFSGCRDDQTSADAHVEGVGSTGAMSHALITALTYNPNMTYSQLLRAIRTLLKGKYEQLPQLSSSKPMDINSNFEL